MNMQQQLTSLRDLFMLFEDPKDKFVQLMDMAKESDQLENNEKVEENKIMKTIIKKLKTFKNLSLNPSEEYLVRRSSAFPSLSLLIFGNIGLENNGLKLHLKGKL